MTTLGTAAKWNERCQDSKYYTLEDMAAAVRRSKLDATEQALPSNSLTAGTEDGRNVCFEVPEREGPVGTTGWAFEQVCRNYGAPAGYLQSLPATLAADCLNHAIKRNGNPVDRTAMIHNHTITAFTSERYARVWNVDLVHRLANLGQNWTGPRAFKTANGHATWGEEHALPLGFTSDRDMFVFLCDYQRPIDIKDGQLFRGFFLENSEVGAGALKLTTFLFDMVCGNMLVWGAENVVKMSARHIGDIEARAHELVTTAPKAFSEGSDGNIVSVIARAHDVLLGDTREDVVNKLYARRSPVMGKKIIDAAYTVVEENPRYGDPRSVWGMVNGLTELSQKLSNASERAALDREAGNILQMVG